MEVEAAVADYLDMLTLEVRGEAFNKAERNRNLRRLLDDRTAGSVERKHQNISAVLIAIGLPYIDGYKPLGNFQALLKDVVEAQLAENPMLEQVLWSLVNSAPKQPPALKDILAIAVPPPEMDRGKTKRVYEGPSRTIQTKRNYLELESRNAALGSAGERLVLEYERERLCRGGARKLADKIIHVSETRGDAEGYDIHSYETDGRDRLIEVKTTRFGVFTPFFASRNEVETSVRRDANYQLYRLYKFDEEPKLFSLAGSLRRTCELEAVSFEVRVGK